MSHHLSTTAIESAADRKVVVEQAPPDSPRQAVAAQGTDPSATTAPVSASSAAAAPTSSSAGASGMSGANVPVESVQAASSSIRDAQTDLASTASAPRRLDGMDGVGGGGGGGGGGDVQETGDGAVAAGTAEQDVSQTGLGTETTDTQTSPEAIDISRATDGGGADTGVAADSNGDPTVGSSTQEV